MTGNIEDKDAFYICIYKGQQMLFDASGKRVWGIIEVKAVSKAGETNQAEVSMVAKHVSYEEMMAEVESKKPVPAV
jgi:hypothetical protein